MKREQFIIAPNVHTASVSDLLFFFFFCLNLGSLISFFTLTIVKTLCNLFLQELILTYRWTMPAEVKNWNNIRILINIPRMNSGTIRLVKNVGHALSSQGTGGQKAHLRPATHIQNGSRQSLYLISVCFKVALSQRFLSCFQCMIPCTLNSVFPVAMKEQKDSYAQLQLSLIIVLYTCSQVKEKHKFAVFSVTSYLYPAVLPTAHDIFLLRTSCLTYFLLIYFTNFCSIFLDTDWTVSIKSLSITYFPSFYFQLCLKKSGQ